jgi:hypothetical protein
MARLWLLISSMILFPVLISSQEISLEDIKHIYMAGISFSQNFKTVDEMTGAHSEDLHYSLNSAGLNYSSFTGDRLGFFSDVNILMPFTSSYESSSPESNRGFSLDYMGGIGWNLRIQRITFLPAAGFHGDYTFLSKDPLDENMSNHLFSFGLGVNLKMLYRIKEKHHVFWGIRGGLDTIEFTSASYDSRVIRLKTKWTYLLSAGYALSL